MLNRLVVTGVVGLSLAACAVTVDDVDPGEAGLPSYPGAQLVRDDPGAKRIQLDSPSVGVHVVAAEYRTNDDAGQVLDFYREALKAIGTVTECRGNVDVGGASGTTTVCTRDGAAEELQLVTGTEADHRLVSVKSRGTTGAEFSVVHVTVRD